MKKNWVFCGVLFLIISVMVLSVYRSHIISNKEIAVIAEDEDEPTIKIVNTKSIGIHDVISSQSNSSAHISDPEIIKQLEDLFNNTSYVKCTDCTPASSLFVSFYNDSSSISFFVQANDIVNIDGINYKSKDITFDLINKLYHEYR